MKKQIDLNADMGEGFGPWTIGDNTDEAIMACISSANVATGFHAGDPSLMARTLRWAKARGVGVGAHPGFRDLVGFGRRMMNCTAEELVNDMLYQLGALRELARHEGMSLQHIKPHGALYMRAANDAELSEALVSALHKTDPSLYLFCMHGSQTWHAAKRMGLRPVGEFFGDRDYDDSGAIVFTRRVGALNPDTVANKVLLACTQGQVQTVSGNFITIQFDSVCIHSDTPGALALIQRTREVLSAHKIEICPLPQVVP